MVRPTMDRLFIAWPRRASNSPSFFLRFWKNRLVYAYLDYKHRFTLDLDDEVHEASVRRTEELLRRLFGEPKKGDANVNRTSLAWENKAIAVDFEVSDDGTHPLGDVTLSVSDRENFVGSSEWQRDADSARGSGPGVTVDCSHTDPVSGFLHIIAETIDTRSLSNRAAIRVAKNRSQMQTPPRFVCHAKAASHRAIDILLNMVKIGQRLPYTYLRFTNEDGFLTSQKFQFAGPDTQDAVCEKYRKRLPRRVRKTATCINRNGASVQTVLTPKQAAPTRFCRRAICAVDLEKLRRSRCAASLDANNSKEGSDDG